MRAAILGILLCLVGCNGFDRLTDGRTHSRNGDYDTSPPPLNVPRAEPYATLAGRHPNGDGTYTNLFLIHWHGNDLDNKSMLEPDVDGLHIPKYKD